MAFTKISELTTDETLALALVQFDGNRFTAQGLAIYLSSLLSDRLTPGTFMVVRGLIDTAVHEGMLQTDRGSQGEGFRIPTLAIELLGDLDLPSELFTRQHRLNGERNEEASADAGPMLRQLLDRIPPHKPESQRELAFVNSVFSHWRDRGRLSSKQVDTIEQIATRYGMFVAAHHYIGRAMDEWRQPYRDAEARRIAATYARDREEKAATQARQQQERVRATAAAHKPERNRDAALAHNRQIKVELEKMERDGGLDQLERLIDAVFPESTLSMRTKVAAYAGAGSKELRVCIAALAFGKPPALVWKQSGQMTQPGAESEQWQTLLIHPALKAFNFRLNE
ncbi:MAG: hypothetical protein ACRYF7_21280 [Janthinobacterium lividum]